MSPEKMYKEIETHLLLDERPSEYLEKVSVTESFLQYPFELLNRMKKTEQSPQYHPEGNVWIHTMMVVDEAAQRRERSRNPGAFMWAALLHDIGKPVTTRYRKGKITSYNHDREGEILAKEFLQACSETEVPAPAAKEFYEEVCGLVRYHMQILFAAKGMARADLEAMKQRVDIREAALLGLCDRLGRAGVNIEEEKKNVTNFLRACGVPESEMDII